MATDAVLSRISEDFDGFAIANAAAPIVTEQDKRVSVRNFETLTTIQTLKGPFGMCEDMAIAGHPEIVATTSSDSSVIRIWSAESGERLSKIDRTASGTVAMTPDGGVLAGAGEPGVIRFWEPLSGHILGEYRFGEVNASGALATLKKIDASITPDGQIMFFVGSDGEIVAWSVSEKRALAKRYFGVHKDDATSIDVLDAMPAVTALNSSIGVVAVKSQIYLWNLASNSIVKSWTASRVVKILVPSNDDRTFFGAADDLISLRWKLPIQELSTQAPGSERELRSYLDDVGVQIVNDPTLGTEVAPRSVVPSPDRVSAMLNSTDTGLQMLALSWIERKPLSYISLIDQQTPLLASTEPRIRELSIRALAKIGDRNDQKIAAAIAPLLLDRDADVRVAALSTIGHFGSAAAVATPELQRVLLTGDVFSPHLGAHVYAPDFACGVINDIGPAAAQAIPQMI